MSVPLRRGATVGAFDHTTSELVVRLCAYAGRTAEMLVALAALALAGPPLLLAALFIALESPGGVLYRQERVGFLGRRFTLYKLRTMIADAEPDGRAVWARASDPRVTGIGRLLRRTHFDELPQLWNVVRGEMRLVGPRPERPGFVAALSASIPDYGLRHTVLPGITGWAQVNYKYAASLDESCAKLALDLEYVRRRSPWFDLLILCRTLPVLVRFDGV